MIYVGYQGIGKSTICQNIDKCVDLESSNFYVDGERNENWHKIYVSIAEHLSNQGKIVFVSSHKAVREEMAKLGIPFKVIYPSLELKGEWIKKLSDRYHLDMTEKNYKALKFAVVNYDESISDLSNEENKIVIDDINYELEKLIEL